MTVTSSTSGAYCVPSLVLPRQVMLWWWSTAKTRGELLRIDMELNKVKNISSPLQVSFSCIFSLSRARALSSFSLAPYYSFANIADNSQIKAKKD
jgi:hypothetical protein